MFASILEGLNILFRYVQPTDTMAAEHDEIWLPGCSPDKMKPEDAARLSELGFDWDESLDSWHRFV